jgi:hypothetical protein
MIYYDLKQTIKLFSDAKIYPCFDLPQIADLCRQGVLTPVFAYNSYGMEIMEYYDGTKPFISKNGGDPEPSTSRRPEPMTTSLYDGYFTHKRLTSLLDKSVDSLMIGEAMTYKSDGAGHEVVLVANPLNINRYLNDENYSAYSDNDGYTVTRDRLLFPSEQVQAYIVSKQKEQPQTSQRIAELESEVADLKEQLEKANAALVAAKDTATAQPIDWESIGKDDRVYPPELHLALMIWQRIYLDNELKNNHLSHHSDKFKVIASRMNLKPKTALYERVKMIINTAYSKNQQAKLADPLRAIEQLYMPAKKLETT